MKFNVSYTSVVMVEAKDIDEAVRRVLNQEFDPADASMPIVLDVEVVEEDDDEDEEEKTPA